MKKPSIKTITVRSLINVLLSLAILLLAVTAFNFRALSLQAIENQAIAHAELVKAGLTAHMKAEVMDKREYYIEEIRQLHQVNSLEIIRGPDLVNQFGEGLAWERTTMDAVARQAFTAALPVIEHYEWSWRPTVRVVIPYIASPEGTLNCLACHNVDAGTVLGAVDMELDVTEYRNHALMVVAGLVVISVVALMLVLVNTSRTIRAYVSLPLNTLMDKAAEAYRLKSRLHSEDFKTRELADVADEFNMFNDQIIAHQDLLREKNRELLELNDEIESTLRETVFTMGTIEEQRSKETANHTKRVSLYSHLLATKLGLSEKQIDVVTVASPLHDIGKLGVPDGILFKPGSLDAEERVIMENHPAIGYAMLQHSQRDILVAAGIIAHQHHEKWDGSGYPQGLKGEEIHIYGRIIALADVFDALYSPRVYKASWPIEEVVDYVRTQRGKHFDPQIADLFLDDVDAFVDIYNRHPANGGEK